MTRGIPFALLLFSFSTAFCSTAFAGTAIKINSAALDIPGEALTVNGINFDSFGPITVTIGNTLLQNCTISATVITCPLSGTPVLTGGAMSWNVSISAGNSPHLNSNIDVFALIEHATQGCTPGSYVDCYSGDPVTRNVGECQTGISSCLNDGTWSTCDGEIIPATEICNDNKDNDCDGLTDVFDPECGCAPLQIVNVVVSSCSNVTIVFDQIVDSGTVLPDGSQLHFDLGLDPIVALVLNPNEINVGTTLQTNGTTYELTIDSSILNLCGRGVDPGGATASFVGCNSGG